MVYIQDGFSFIDRHTIQATGDEKFSIVLLTCDPNKPQCHPAKQNSLTF